MSDETRASAPRLGGHATDLLADAPERAEAESLRVGSDHSPVTITEPDQLAALALGAVLAREVARAGGTRIDEYSAERVLERAWRALDEKARVELEIEAHATLSWIARAFGSPEPPPPQAPAFIHPESSHQSVIRWAIAQCEDLTIEMWDPDKGSLDTLRVTPLAIEVGHYLRLFDYKLGDTRVVRLHLLSEVAPARGWPPSTQGPAAPPLPIEAYEGVDAGPRRPVPPEPEPEHRHVPHSDALGQMLMFDEEE